MVKDPPANAGDMGSIPGLERSRMLRSNEARVPQLLSLCSRARGPQLLSPPGSRARALRQDKPCTSTRESPCSNEDPAQPKTIDNRKSY